MWPTERIFGILLAIVGAILAFFLIRELIEALDDGDCSTMKGPAVTISGERVPGA